MKIIKISANLDCGMEDSVFEVLEQKLEKIIFLTKVTKVAKELMEGVDIL